MKSSLRPKARPMDLTPEAESGDSDLIRMEEKRKGSDDGGAVERGNNAARRRAKEGSPDDAAKFVEGGMVRAGDVRDNPKRGKCY